MVDLIKEITCGVCPYKEVCEVQCSIAYLDTLSINRGLRDWLSSFNTNSATECFEAVNILKERVEHE